MVRRVHGQDVESVNLVAHSHSSLSRRGARWVNALAFSALGARVADRDRGVVEAGASGQSASKGLRLAGRGAMAHGHGACLGGRREPVPRPAREAVWTLLRQRAQHRGPQLRIVRDVPRALTAECFPQSIQSRCVEVVAAAVGLQQAAAVTSEAAMFDSGDGARRHGSGVTLCLHGAEHVSDVRSDGVCLGAQEARHSWALLGYRRHLVRVANSGTCWLRVGS